MSKFTDKTRYPNVTTPADADEVFGRQAATTKPGNWFTFSAIWAAFRAKFTTTPVTLAEGGTGANSAATARTALGLGNVDNTSDANKPVSTAQAAADLAVANAAAADATAKANAAQAAVTWNSLPSKPLVIAAGNTVEEARDIIKFSESVAGLNTQSDRSALALAAAEQNRSAAFMLVAREDFAAFAEDWSDLASWTLNGSGIQVSAGRLYSTGSGGSNSNANYGASIGIGQNSRYVGTIVIPAGSNSGGAMFGFSSATAGAAPLGAGGNTKGLYFRTAASNVQTITNGSFADVSPTVTIAAATWNLMGATDANYLSVVGISSDISTTVRARFARASGDANNITIFNSDARALSGIYVGPVGFRGSAATVSPGTGIEGRVFGVFTGDGTYDFRITTPANYDSRLPCPIVILCHGNGSGIDHFDDNSNGRAARNAFLNQGFITVAAVYPANQATWGASVGLAAYVAAYKYTCARYNIGAVVIYGNSMGGLESLLLAASRDIPGVVAWAATVPAWSLASAYTGAGGGTSFGSAINTAYNIPGGGSYDEQTAGHDPALLNASQWGGLPMYMIDASDDAVLPTALHGDALADSSAAALSADFVRVEVTGGHSSVSIASQLPALASWALTKCVK